MGQDRITKLIGINDAGTHELIGVYVGGKLVKTITRRILANVTRKAYCQTCKHTNK